MNVRNRIIAIGIITIMMGSCVMSADLGEIWGKMELIGTASGTTFTVDDDAGMDYQSIQDAVDAASDGDTVYVYPGEYDEYVTIAGKSINLIGDDRDTTIISADILHSGIRVESDGNNISGFTVKWGWWGIDINSSDFNNIRDCEVTLSWNCGIFLDNARNNLVENCQSSANLVGMCLTGNSHNNTISDCDISLNTNNGLSMLSGDNNIIKNNLVEGNDLLGGSDNYPGFYLKTDHNDIFGNTFDLNLATGLYADGASGNKIYGNNFTFNDEGLRLDLGSCNNDIYENEFSDNDYFGASIANGSSQNSLRNNSFHDNGKFITDYPALVVMADDNRISGNQIDGNYGTGIYLNNGQNNILDNNSIFHGNYGILVKEGQNNLVENNTCTQNWLNGICLNGTSGNTVSNNIAMSNADFGICLTNSSTNVISFNNCSRNFGKTKFSYTNLDSFEGEGDEGWHHAGTNDCWDRGAPSAGPWYNIDGYNSWGTDLAGDYPNNAECSLYSPTVHVDSKTVLEFWHWYEFEEDWDWGYVEICLNGTNQWDILAMFTGYSDWTHEYISLEGYDGNVDIRFRLSSDFSNTETGWLVDFVSLDNMAINNFEGDTDDGLVHGGIGDTWDHGKPTSGPNEAHSQSKVWGTQLTGDYSNSSNATLTLPEFILSEDTSLGFWHWHDLAQGDFGYVEISNDGGVTWDILATYAKDSADWVRETISLENYSGTVRIRFRLNTDDILSSDGWYLDDVMFVEGGGLLLDNSDQNIVEGNICNNTQGGGMVMRESHNNILTDNSFKFNRNHGLKVKGANGNLISNNSGYFNKEAGASISSSSQNTISKNDLASNLIGLVLAEGCANNLVDQNDLQSNDQYGILVHTSSRNLMSWNSVLYNGEAGVMMEGGSLNTLDNNSINFNDDGILMVEETDCLITDNTLYYNWYRGIGLNNSHLNSLVDNYIIYNFHGIQLKNSTEVVASDNLVTVNWVGFAISQKSNHNLVTGNFVENNLVGMLLWDDVDGNELEYNTLYNNTYYGIWIEDIESEQNTIHHNNFMYNNGDETQAFDNGTDNHWDDSVGEGNFWSNYQALYPQATNDGLVWSIPHTMLGEGGAADNFPLVYTVSGGDLEMPEMIRDNTPTLATTGDNFTFSAEFTDNLGIGMVVVSYTYDGTNFTNESLVCMGNDTWEHTIEVEAEAKTLQYYFQVLDMGLNKISTELTGLDVLDNDLPTMVNNTTPTNATTGDNFTFSAEFHDNMGVDAVSVLYSLDQGEVYAVDMVNSEENNWSATILVQNKAQEMRYHFFFTDGTNAGNTTDMTVTVLDDDAPVLILDHSATTGTTGDNFVFSLEVSDNMQLASVSVNYSGEDGAVEKELIHQENLTWNLTVILPHSTEFNYTFTAVDGSGNERKSNLTHITIVDNDAPVAIAGDDIVVEGGNEAFFNGSLSLDNIGIEKYEWTMTYNTEIITLEGKTVSFTFEKGGRYTIILNVTDREGNWGIDLVNVTVRDTTSPIAMAGDDRNVDQHEIVVFNASKSLDDTALDNFTWTFIVQGTIVTLWGMEAQYIFVDAGTYNVTLNVSDGEGNWGLDTLAVLVNDITAPQVNAGRNLTVNLGDTVEFNGTSSWDDVGIIGYTWTFNYGYEIITLEGAQAQFVFDRAGNYIVTLTAIDLAGNVGSADIKITVQKGDGSDEIPSGREDRGIMSGLSLLVIVFVTVVIIAILVLLVMLKRRKNDNGEENTADEEEGDGETEEASWDDNEDEEEGMDEEPIVVLKIKTKSNEKARNHVEMKERAIELHLDIDPMLREAKELGIGVQQFKADYEVALDLFKQKDFGEAVDQFEHVVELLKDAMVEISHIEANGLLAERAEVEDDTGGRDDGEAVEVMGEKGEDEVMGEKAEDENSEQDGVELGLLTVLMPL